MPFDRYISHYMNWLQGAEYLIRDIALPTGVLVMFTLLALVASGFPRIEKWREYFVYVGHVYLFLAFAGFLNIYFHEFVYNGHNLLPWLIDAAGLGNLIPVDKLTPNLGTLKALIPLFTFAGAIPSFVMLKAIAKKYSLPSTVYRAHQVILGMTSIAFLALL